MNTNRHRKWIGVVAVAATLAFVRDVSAVTIDIVPNAALSANQAALDAFDRAAGQWESLLADPINITIRGSLVSLSPGIIGSTTNTLVTNTFNQVRTAMIADSADELDDGIVAALPTFQNFNAYIPNGTALTGNILMTAANAKALGIASANPTDAMMSFSTNIAFDYDNRDGVGDGLTDFETVAAHEIGHVLGFVSAVENVNAGAVSVTPYVLDLFRFRDDTAGSDPTGPVDFTTGRRDFIPGQTDIFDDTQYEWQMSTGLISGPIAYPGRDGRHASHWKDDTFTGTPPGTNPGPLIGLMDPTLATAGNANGYPFIEAPSFADLRVMDLIGYEFNSVPEPSALAVLAFAGLHALGRRRSA